MLDIHQAIQALAQVPAAEQRFSTFRMLYTAADTTRVEEGPVASQSLPFEGRVANSRRILQPLNWPSPRNNCRQQSPVRACRL